MTTSSTQIGAGSSSPPTAGSAFRGTTYIYQTPKGPKEIGVTTGLGGTPIVAWIAPSGAKKRVKTPALPAGIPPDELQAKLDAWAAARRLPQNKVLYK